MTLEKPRNQRTRSLGANLGPPLEVVTTKADDLVWYAAYGSNMATRRLICYLEGGCPPGGLRGQRGARDPSPPRDVRAMRIPHRLRFADESTVWTGGKAFISSRRRGWAFARAWLIRREQFHDLCAQENGRPPGATLVPRVADGGHIDVGAGPYDRVLGCGQLEGIPVVTLTHPGAPRLRAPSVPYLRILAHGLREAHGLSTRASASYLAAAEGVTASASELAELIAPLEGDAPLDRRAPAPILPA